MTDRQKESSDDKQSWVKVNMWDSVPHIMRKKNRLPTFDKDGSLLPYIIYKLAGEINSALQVLLRSSAFRGIAPPCL